MRILLSALVLAVLTATEIAVLGEALTWSVTGLYDLPTTLSQAMAVLWLGAGLAGGVWMFRRVHDSEAQPDLGGS